MSSDAETMKKTDKRTLTPKLRFPEFRNQGDWELVTLGQLASLSSGGTPSKDNPAYWNGNIPWISALSMHDVRVEDSETRVTTDAIGNGTRIAEEGSILILIRGSMLFKRVPICITLRDVAFNQDVKALRLKKGNDPLFVLNQLIASESRIAIHSTGIGAGKIDTEHLKNLELGCPSPAEQQKIAECLNSLDGLIAAEGRKLEALRAHKKGLMQQLFPREGETRPRLRLPEFRNAGEWEKAPLSKYVRSLDAGVSVVSGDRPAGVSEVGILKTSAVTDGVFNPQENKVVLDKDELQRVKEPVSENSIIISRMNTPALVGANAYVANSLDNIFLPDRLWAAKPRPNVSMRFIAFVIGSEKGRAALSELATGTSGSMKNITKPDVLALEITAPSFAEQQRIASCLTSLDDLIAARARRIATLQTHKKGLMHQLFPSPEEVEG